MHTHICVNTESLYSYIFLFSFFVINKDDEHFKKCPLDNLISYFENYLLRYTTFFVDSSFVVVLGFIVW